MTDPAPARDRALVVYESLFGNTAQVAGAVAETLKAHGYDVTLSDVTDPAAPSGRLDADLVVVGAPTHAFSLSRASTRADAVRQGAEPGKEGTGLREWLESVVPRPGRRVPVVAFDTRVEKVRRLPMAAGPRALRLARHQGFDGPVRPAAFLVRDTAGPLLDDELARARSWAATVAESVRPAHAGRADGRRTS